MADNKKNDSKSSSSSWRYALLGLDLVFALLLGMWFAFERDVAGGFAFLILLAIGFLIVPQKSRTLFSLAYVAIFIGMLILTILWGTIGEEATKFEEASTVFSVVMLFLGLSLLFGLGIVALTILVGTLFMVPWVQKVGGHADMQSWELSKFLLRSFLGLGPSYLVISGDKIIAESPKGIMPQVGGPGLAIIKPETAVVFEHLGNVSRITGPATLKDIRMFELPKAIIDLRPQWDTTGVFVVSTQDGEQVQVSARYQCAMMTRKQLADEDCPPLDQSNPPTPTINSQVNANTPSDPAVLPGASNYCKDTIRRAAYDSGPEGWLIATRETVRWALRTEIERRTLEDLFPALNPVTGNKRRYELNEIPDAVRTRARAVTARWGVHVDVLSVDQINPPATVTEATRAMRQSRIDVEAVAAAGRAEAGVYAGLQTVEAQAQEAKMRILVRHVTSVADELPDEQVLAFFELVERVANIIINHRTVDYRYVKALEALAENPNARIIIQPGANGVMVENIME